MQNSFISAPPMTASRRLDPFAKPLASGRSLRTPAGRSRREDETARAVVRARACGKLQRAEDEREGSDCLKIVGFNPMRDRSLRDAREAHQPASPAHDRRHDGAPVQGEGAEGLRPARQDLRGLPRPVAGHGDERGPSPLSAAHGAATDQRRVHQRRRRRAAVFLQRDARTPRPCPSSDDGEHTL